MHYRIFAETKFLEDCGYYRTYGISAVICGQTAYTIEDISLDKDKIERLTAKFNEEGLEPQHFEQAVEEFLYSFEV
ncbi:MAG: hypothetical protein IJ171_03375 [Ruminococcus sp.]|jgi:hypothetical protein|nr:hypothetical protein [Ruminococcus sp.]